MFSVAISTILQIAGIGFLTAVLQTVLKAAGKDEFSNWVTLTGIAVALVLVLSKLEVLLTEITSVFRFQ
ncbi:stage III sporulation protein AC [Effusibacillus lacus]|uniref:Stage III sporulation protein AC n=1 Tax=Effusibacillus lacus TaxID=1348429 RepID=A0A292YQ67_9BACL|nr:stage III sporulation protein AC [Effusibacillus lacus]TCS72534.1 stage III sporulation protein AC [Effusibacillus lacus]GAX90903.1 stage III sporulation protein AC [Effusibacillus lacus]